MNGFGDLRAHLPDLRSALCDLERQAETVHGSGNPTPLPMDGRAGSGVRDSRGGLVRGQSTVAAEKPAGQGAAGGAPEFDFWTVFARGGFN